MATLAEQLRDLCVEHDLNCVSVQFHIGAKTGRPFVSANAHYGGRCTSGNGATAEEALGAAIATANAERNRGTATSDLCTLGDVVGTRRAAMDELLANDADLIGEGA
jgi:L-rhamnose isomerase